jgi:hypothetical protein
MGTFLRALWFFFRTLGLVVGVALIVLGLLGGSWLAKLAGWLFGVPILAFSAMITWSFLRPNRAEVDPSAVPESWDVVNDGLHNSNTDMIVWKGMFYLAHAASPFHLGSSECKLVLLRSSDGRCWEQIATLDTAPEDIRDPKFAVIHDQLFLYALKNRAINPEPYTTVYSCSTDGVHWAPFQEIEPKGWLFWRPKSADGHTCYVPAYWWEHGKSILLSSTDGASWSILSEIYRGDRNDETDFEFLPDGRMIATARLEFSESWLGHPEGETLIAVSSPPFDSWHVTARSRVTRLDGPNLFAYHGQVYAVGRYQPVQRGPFSHQGSILARKRTSLFRVQEQGLVRLTDLPSAGDTSYAGIAIRREDLYVCYYTSDVHKDYIWLVGMFSPSSIRMARVSLPALEALARRSVTLNLQPST